MPNLWETLNLPLPTATPQGVVRQQALMSVDYQPEPTSVLSYQSSGRILIIGPTEDAIKVAQELPDECQTTVLITNPVENTMTGERPAVFFASLESLTGHLGAFEAQVSSQDKKQNLANLAGHADGMFDIVLDLQQQPAINAEIAPPGYFPVAESEHLLESAREQIPELTGEFDKPKFFNYDTSICAHSRSGLNGCTRCLDACPTQAIQSLSDQGREQIEVDPYLCQGGGSCTSACPSGAISYAYPKAEDLLAVVRQLLKQYRDKGGENCELLIFDSENSRPAVELGMEQFPDNVLPLQVEEIGSVGLDLLLCALAYGVDCIKLFVSTDCAPSVKRTLDNQAVTIKSFLSALNLGEGRVVLVDEQNWLSTSPDNHPVIKPASFAAIGDKRTIMRMAIDHLYQNASTQPESIDLPQGAIFGELAINADGCTLCMACVSICPMTALQAGGEQPQLKFIEANCVQCGICAQGCPEEVITLKPRYLFDTQQLIKPRVLNEETPFCCVSCGKPFATQSMITRMRDKLSGHWMFQKDGAIKRLEMCEDCRIKDMFDKEGSLS